MTRLPQVLVNVRVAGSAVAAAASLAPDVAAAEAELGATGRVLVRAERHRADRAGHGRGGRPRRGRAGRTRPGRRPGGPGPPLASPPMCGIVAILTRPGSRPTPSAEELLGALDAAVHVPTGAGPPAGARPDGRRGRQWRTRCSRRARRAGARRPAVPGRRHRGPTRPAWTRSWPARRPGSRTPTPTRSTSSGPTPRSSAARDVLWALRRDRLRTAAAVSALAGREAGEAALAGFLVCPAGPVRHRPPGGSGPGLGRAAPVRVGPRARPRRSRARQPAGPSQRRPAVPVRRGPGGRRRAVVRLQGRSRDRRARRQHRRPACRASTATGCSYVALASPGARLSVLGHTRWASVGIISEPNTHPVNSEEDRTTGGRTWSRRSTATSTTTPTCGPASELSFPPPITTDAKVIPSLVSRERR